MTFHHLIPTPVLENMLLKVMRKSEFGSLKLITPANHELFFEGPKPGPKADITINNWSMVKSIINKGDVGLGEDYIDGIWSSDDLPALLTFCTLNIDAMEKFFHGWRWMKVWFRLKNFLRSNTRRGSRKNIQAHYDVGNAFYRLWLDNTMTYSSALYNGDYTQPLEAAQTAKYQRILDRLNEGKTILEIGCGWGGFAERAVENSYEVTCLTLSTEQADYAKKRLSGKPAEIKLEDYRDVQGTYDHIVSIEMFEAVGERYWKQYFDTIKARLKPGGNAVVQVIVIDDSIFEEYRLRSDFIQQYTFPGGMLPSVSAFRKAVSESGLACGDIFHFGKDYAETLRIWLQNLEQQVAAIRALDYSEAFLRSWRFYLSYCIAGFATGRTDVIQVELTHA